MECEDIKSKMAPFLSGEINDAQSDEIRQHLMQCNSCQQELDSYKEVWNMLEACEDKEPDPGYIPRFWERVASECLWRENLGRIFGVVFGDKRFVPMLSVVSVVLLVGMIMFRTIEVNQTEMLLTKLSVEEIEFVENLELAENLEMLEQMDFLESLDGLDDLTWREQLRVKNV